MWESIVNLALFSTCIDFDFPINQVCFNNLNLLLINETQVMAP